MGSRSIPRAADRRGANAGTHAAPGEPGGRRPALEIVVPVHNEQHVLRASVRTLRSHLDREFPFPVRITIVDNASSDGTLQAAQALARELPQVKVVHLDRKGRGGALRAAWGASDADVVAYTDVDLSTELSALGALVTPLLEERGDIAIGSRLTPGAQVVRGLEREVLSRGYNLLLRLALGVGFSDAQCGLKAGRRELIQELLPDVQDDGWFFDTELLVLAQRRKIAIHEVPVRWVEDRDSRVAVLATVRENLRGVQRLRRAMRTGGSGVSMPRSAPAAAHQNGPGPLSELGGHAS